MSEKGDVAGISQSPRNSNDHQDISRRSSTRNKAINRPKSEEYPERRSQSRPGEPGGVQDYNYHEKTFPGAPPDGVPVNENDSMDNPDGLVFLPDGWKYAQPPGKLLKWVFPWYASPKVQLGMVAVVCFLCPGMFNALGGLGGGGRKDATLSDNMVSS
jgi:hypothetical protein